MPSRRRIFGEAALREVVTKWPQFRFLNISSTGVRETDHEWSLGHVGVFKEAPQFSFGYVYNLEDTSRFRKARFDFPDLGQRGWAAVFRVRDHHENIEESTEYFAAWVTDDHEADLDTWIAFLNDHIKRLLEKEHAFRDAR